MPLKSTGDARFDSTDPWAGGTTWIAHPEESMRRASHALVVDEESWLVDPVDCDGLDDHLADLGAVAGIVVLLDRHKRDAGAIARRHDVAVHIPEWMDGVAEEIDAPVETFGTTFADAYTVYPLSRSRFWQEAALYDEENGTLVVPEAVGTASYFLAGDERLGVHPMKRLRPPRRLHEFDPERILVGHGKPVTTDAVAALDDALDGARRRTPALYAKAARELIFG
ncbi:hypothetical protein [Halorhabdus rudnickae]|uniref:hypothetical protein n=1 Tax=Halorhabdus rudnickae TaxID=1775544 RepID=UPI00108463CA|nr:hypothetical protein [Halorhabdus rudnickae]